MTAEERRTVMGTALLLLIASLIRFGWEARVSPPVLPPAPVPEALVTATREAVAAEERRRTPLAPGERLDPNQASEVELARLPGVGPALASRIIEHREAAGPFGAVDGLLAVSGIGAATLERLRPHLEIRGGGSRPSPGAGRFDAGRAAPGREGSGGAASGRVDVGPGGAGRIHVNRAGVQELQALPGIGPALAARIVERREANGPFRSIEELMDVPGIGPALLERIRPRVQVEF